MWMISTGGLGSSQQLASLHFLLPCLTLPSLGLAKILWLNRASAQIQLLRKLATLENFAITIAMYFSKCVVFAGLAHLGLSLYQVTDVFNSSNWVESFNFETVGLQKLPWRRELISHEGR